MSIHRKKTTLRFALAALITSIVVMLGYTTFVTTVSNKTAIAKIENQKRALVVASSLFYGKVDSVDPTNRTVTARIFDPFSPADSRKIVFRVTSDALIAQQYLLGENGVYTALTERSPSTLNDIPVGTHIATLLWGTGTKMESNLLIFGDPL